ncbi:DUF1571 domain-containing protein [Aeoliella sp. ICT_H6.2]|uniref:DUF1571 domain-containing protein n=1 Tax=Aeoliella straminimaris TaxID=2954799 RepID=A0A9X2F8T3_9BACT|nr:DUF1571 domain-containing protein [Aeoliella straminimaris]MCO6044462.1 DUF1571 domain-containing protein [Aeoliella straminimaris]
MIKVSTTTCRLASCVAVFTVASAANAQQERGENLREPVYRVAHETPAKTVSAHAVPVADFFDLTQHQGEHPLAPCKRLAERVKTHIDANVHDYSCTFWKRELIDGKLQDYNCMSMRVMHDPFSVHLLFKKPKQGQECLYVEGQNGGKMRARGHGWRATVAGVLTLDPTKGMAMEGQRHPITMAGVKNLTDQLITIAENDMQYGECEVKTYSDATLGKGEAARPAVMLEITHPVPRREFKFHVAKIYIDKELKIPVRFEAYDWKKDSNGNPELVEFYMYTDVKINNGYTTAHFSEAHPEIFK